MPDRAALSRTFLDRAGWGAASRAFLAGDASARRYERLAAADGTTAVLMDAPPEAGEDVAAFTRIARHLSGIGLSAPKIFAEDAAHGFLLIEDLGDALFARLLEADPERETDLYTAATDLLVHLQARPPASRLPVYDVPMLAKYVSVFADFYVPALTGRPGKAAPLVAAMRAALTRLAPKAKTMILRDYHAENLLWLPGRSGLARVGVLDFQQAMLCHPAYDLVSLLQDARRDISPAVEEAMIARFIASTGADADGFRAAYAALGAQRNLRILGVFAKLAKEQGKTRYLAFVPRVWALVQRDLTHPELADLARIVTKMAPSPAVEALTGIVAT